MSLILQVIFIFLMLNEKVKNLPIGNEISNTELPSLDFKNLDQSKFEYLKHVNQYLNEKLNKLSKNNLKDDLNKDTTSNNLNDQQNQDNQTNQTIQTNEAKLARTSLIDKFILILWTLKEIAKLRLLSLDESSYAKQLYMKANELNREDVCIPFMLGLIAGLIFLIILSILKCCLNRLCSRRHSVNRLNGIYKKRLINKRNPLDETHHLLVNHNLSDQEI